VSKNNPVHSSVPTNTSFEPSCVPAVSPSDPTYNYLNPTSIQTSKKSSPVDTIAIPNISDLPADELDNDILKDGLSGQPSFNSFSSKCHSARSNPSISNLHTASASAQPAGVYSQCVNVPSSRGAKRSLGVTSTTASSVPCSASSYCSISSSTITSRSSARLNVSTESASVQSGSGPTSSSKGIKRKYPDLNELKTMSQPIKKQNSPNEELNEEPETQSDKWKSKYSQLEKVVHEISDDEESDQVLSELEEHKSDLKGLSLVNEGEVLCTPRVRKPTNFFGEFTDIEEMNSQLRRQSFIKIKQNNSIDGQLSSKKPKILTENKILKKKSKSKVSSTISVKKPSNEDPIIIISEVKSASTVDSSGDNKLSTVNKGFDCKLLSVDDSFHNKLLNLNLVDLLKCSNCSEYFDSTLYYEDHVKKVHEFPCQLWPECKALFVTRIDVYKHVMQEHRSVNVFNKLKKCGLCDSLIDVKSVNHHKPNSHTRSCPKCKLLFSNPRDLLQHFVKVHMRG